MTMKILAASVLLAMAASCRAAPFVAVTVDGQPVPGEALAAMRALEPNCWDPCGELRFQASHDVAIAKVVGLGTTTSTVLYNRTNIDRIRHLYGSAAVAFVFGHEYGHHLDRNSILRYSTHPMVEEPLALEARADAFGGCAVAILGLPFADVEALLDGVAAGDAEHAPGSIRIEDARRGYEGCRKP